MKRIFSALMAMSAIISIVGCNNKKTSDGSSGTSSDTADSSVPASTQPDPLDTAAKTTASATEASTVPEETTAPASEAPAAPATEAPDISAFEYNDDGAVIFEESYEKESDATLIAAAQSLFESACRTEWKFTIGCPYNTDTADYIENEFQWQFYRITDSGITTLADVENDYYKVFSRKYPNLLNELFIAGDGAVYALNASRGADIFYEKSTITEITSRTDEEIFFTVENHYTGTDMEPDMPEIRTDTFSVVIENDGAWRAGKFNLPY